MSLYAIRFSFDGKNYNGWQKQKNKPSVQQTLEECLCKITNENVAITASGRTDAGVSAISQVATFRTEKELDEKKFVGRINNLLPDSVRVTKIKKMQDNFHVMHSATEKAYCYNFYINNNSVPYLDRFATRFSEKTDINIIKNNLKHFIGLHDFTSFCNTESTSINKVREIYNLKLTENIGFYTITISGNGFLYNMIRIIIGTLVDISTGKIGLSVYDILQAKNRLKAGRTASSKGLVLLNVKYNEEI